MLNLQTKLTYDAATIASANLTGKFSEEDLCAIGTWVLEGYERDERSRAKWLKRNEAGMDLAMQIQKTKSFPWPNCSNVAFPLITIATMQFHARAYDALLDGPRPVRGRVTGEDPEGKLAVRADKISAVMSRQILEEDTAWEEQHDKLLINLPVVGTAFKKTYHSARLGHRVSELVLARDLVVDYYTKSLDECPRKTHIIQLYRNDIYERVKRGTYRNVLEETWYTTLPPPPQPAPGVDNRKGQTAPDTPDETTPFVGLEQHCNLDLDKDGYAEPYIITIEKDSKAVLRIITGAESAEHVERDAKGAIISVRKVEYFTKYPFIPSPDGGFYDMGFGVFLGPLNESVNTIINQLIDAGTMASTAGGFLAKGAKIRGGSTSFSPFQWNRVDVAGDDIRKAMFGLPVREPSQVLYHLLVLLIDYTNRISGASGVVVGDSPGQNTPAETSRTVLEQGLKIYNSTFKRIWRAMKEEFGKLYILNGMYLKGDERALFLGDPKEVVPAADPTLAGDQAQLQKAIHVKQAAASTPGYDLDAVEMFFLHALHVDGAERLYKGQASVPPQGPSEKVQIAQLKAEVENARLQAENAQFAAEMMETVRLNNAEIAKMEAQAIKLLSDASNDSMQQQVSLMQTAIGAMKQRNESILAHVKLVMEGIKDVNANRGRVSSVAQPPNNPVVPAAGPRMEAGLPRQMGGRGVFGNGTLPNGPA